MPSTDPALSSREISLQDAAGQTWDVVVVGTGVGGATFGWAMARAGHRVLFCERGSVFPRKGEVAIQGNYPEEQLPGHAPDETAESLAALSLAGRDTDALTDESTPRVNRFLPFIGSGPGGSSALYGMAMERFFPSDFEPRRHHSTSEENSLVEQWPIDYSELAPWYDLAESLYQVRGGIDPLRALFDFSRTLPPAPPMTRANTWLSRHLAETGSHPYRLPMACAFVDGCRGCQGFICDKRCKRDSNTVCIEPAIRDLGASIVSRCRAIRFNTRSRLVTGLVCVDSNSKEFILHARRFALAAGALRSPTLLLQSADERHIDGLGNSSGLVGKNLMRHYIDLWAVKPPRDMVDSLDNRHKQLAFNDLYLHKNQKLGSVQSFGRLPPAKMLWASLLRDVRHSRHPMAEWPLRSMAPLIQREMKHLEGEKLLLASTVEDLPFQHNQVMVSKGGPDKFISSIKYRLTKSERGRVALMRTQMAQRLKGLTFMRLSQAENNERIAHACGTCRFGDSAKSSVLDRFNRVHDIDNLWVLDASFFPSSGGTNPSLTVAANALRVAASVA